MTTLLWLQTGSCGGDTMSILCADSPSLEEMVDDTALRCFGNHPYPMGRRTGWTP